MQIQTGPESGWAYKSVPDCAKKIYKGHGMTGMFRGQTATMLRDSWGYGVYFAVYEVLKNWKYPIQPDGTREHPPLPYVMAIGSTTGVIMWTACFPFDVIKTEMQVDNLAKKRFANSMDATRAIWQRAGWRGFFQGLSPCAARGIPVNAAVFGGFEVAMKLLKDM
jgi:solute carrier family 25 carnitine/acylcarnitine transporter 20/29